jgi:hypothetical protein
MPMQETVDEVIATGPRPNAAAGATTRRGMVDESVRSGELESHREPNATAQPDTVGGGRAGRPMKESTLKLLDKLNMPDEGDGGDPDDPDAAPPKPADPAAPVAAAPGETAVVDDKPSDIDVVRAENARLAEHNRKLVADVEAAGKVKRGEPSARDKALDEAERMYLDDNVGAIRKLIATVLGVDDPKHPDVDGELAGLYTDLTARELNVPLEQATKAVREAARAKQMLARDKRERKAEEEAKATKVEPDQEAKRAEEVGTFIEGRLTSKAADGQSIGDQYPLLMSLAEDLDGLKPSDLLWRVLQVETKAGNIEVVPDNDKMLHAAARLIEAHYATVAEKISSKVKPKTDTATTGDKPATPVTTREVQRQGQAARSITNAQASVAPAAPPKQQQPQQVAPERPKFKSKKEAQDFALRHLPQ